MTKSELKNIIKEMLLNEDLTGVWGEDEPGDVNFSGQVYRMDPQTGKYRWMDSSGGAGRMGALFGGDQATADVPAETGPIIGQPKHMDPDRWLLTRAEGQEQDSVWSYDPETGVNRYMTPDELDAAHKVRQAEPAPPTPAAIPGRETMTRDEYDEKHGKGAALRAQQADIAGGGTGFDPGEGVTRKEIGLDPDDSKPEPKPDPKPKPKKKKKKKRKEAEEEKAATDAAKSEAARVAAEQEWDGAQQQSQALALENAATLFGAMRGWGTDEAAVNMALTNALDGEGLPAVYDAYDQILQQAVRMGIADADDGDLVQWLKDDGMDEWAMQVAVANQEQRRTLGAGAAAARRRAAGEGAASKSTMKERTIYSSYQDQHKLFENWNKFVKRNEE